jgi:MoaA/NifB/PqqE/SkfB family radical SAM enzyme
MTLEEMKEYIRLSVKAFPTIKVVVFTGGECTLLDDKLYKIIEYCKTLNLFSRVISNAHWADTEQNAIKMIGKLESSGLTEINFSTGTEHQQFVPLEYIINAVKVSCESDKISSVSVVIESNKTGNLTTKEFWNDERLKIINEDKIKKLNVLSSTWMPFRQRQLNCSTNNFDTTEYKGCNNIFKSININPEGQLLACCGFACEYSPFLKLGNFHYDVEKLYIKQFNDVLKLWLYTDGPQKILSELGMIYPNEQTHDCDYCLRLLTNKDCIQQLLNMKQSKIKSILLNYNLKIN